MRRAAAPAHRVAEVHGQGGSGQRVHRIGMAATHELDAVQRGADGSEVTAGP